MNEWGFIIVSPYEEEIYSNFGYETEEEAENAAKRHMAKVGMSPKAYTIRTEQRWRDLDLDDTTVANIIHGISSELSNSKVQDILIYNIVHYVAAQGYDNDESAEEIAAFFQGTGITEKSVHEIIERE